MRVGWVSAIVVGLVAAVVAQAQPTAQAPPPEQGGSGARDATVPAGLPAIGKWMIASDGSIAHWLGEVYEGKRLREPINVILVDAAAGSAEEAKLRVVDAAITAGYPIRFGHSTGYRALIGGDLYLQVPAGRDDAFSNGIFELSNNHGRMFGPHAAEGHFVSTGAFSREAIRPFRYPEHGFASFNQARDDFAHQLDSRTTFKLIGFVDLKNAIVDDPGITTGDHDGMAVLLRATK